MYVLSDPENYSEWRAISESRLEQARILIDSGSKTMGIYLLCHSMESSLKGFLKARERNGTLARLGHDLETLRQMLEGEIPKSIFSPEAAKILSIVDSTGNANYTLLRYQSSPDCIPQIDTTKLLHEVAKICNSVNRRSHAYFERRKRR